MKRKIAIITGGNSSEVVISLKSAQQLDGMIDKLKYDVSIISIIGSEWKGVSEDIKDLEINKHDFSVIKSGEKITWDFALLALHGTPGEDGRLQSYFELVGIPYSTCGVYSSSITFNKYASKILLKEFGIDSARTVRIKRDQKYNSKEIIKELGLPCFVKPNEAGSSFGVSKVESESQFQKAVEDAFKEDSQVLIEEALNGTEVTCGVLKLRNGKEYIMPITEIRSKTGFFDYKAKYEKGFSEEITPAPISEKDTIAIKKLSSEIYDIFDCKGIVRVDFIFKDGRYCFLEVNTVPGLSAESIIPQQIRAMGMKPEQIFTEVIEDNF